MENLNNDGANGVFFESSDLSFELTADRAFYADPEKQYFIEI